MLVKWTKADRIVVLHGTADRLIPVSMGRQAAQAREGIGFFLSKSGAIRAIRAMPIRCLPGLCYPKVPELILTGLAQAAIKPSTIALATAWA